MMKFLRSQSQAVLVVVLAFIALGFLFYGNAGNLITNTGARVSSDYGRIDGDDLTVAELTDAVRNVRDSLIINGQSDVLRQPGASALIAKLAWQQLLFLREADRLHITVSDRQLVTFIQQLPVFQKDGVYNPDVYDQQMRVLQNVLHIPSDGAVDAVANTKTIFENVLRNDLRTEAVRQALFSSVRSSAGDVTEQYEKYYGPATVSTISFDPKSFLATVRVTPADIEAEYKAHPENPDYRTQEKRKVDYVLYMLTPEQAKLPDAEKQAAKDALGQKALDFALALEPDPNSNPDAIQPTADFMTEAKKAGLNPGTTDFFAADQPPAGVPPSPSFNNAAFALARDNPISKVVDLANGVAILHLNAIQASDLRPIGEVTAGITAKLQQIKAQQAAQDAAQSASGKLKDAMAKGTDFKTAAATLGLKIDTLPPFVPAKASQSDQRQQSIAISTARVKTGQVSDPIPLPDQSILVLHVDSRLPADPDGLAQFEARYRQSQDNQLRQQVYTDWSDWKSNQPGTHTPPQLEAYGSVE